MVNQAHFRSSTSNITSARGPGCSQGHLYLRFTGSSVKSFIHLLERERTTALSVQTLDASELQCQLGLLLTDLKVGETYVILLSLSAFLCKIGTQTYFLGFG